MNFSSVSGVFEAMGQNFNSAAAAGVDAVFQFNISGDTGGQWSVAIKDGQCAIQPGEHANPSVTLGLSDDNWLKLVNGELSAMTAFMTGKIKAHGNIMLASQLGKLFGFKV